MKFITGFSKTNEDPDRPGTWNGYPNKTLGGTEVEISDIKHNITPGIRKVLVDLSYETAKSMNDMDKVVVGDMLTKTKFHNRIPTKGRISGRDR